MRKLRIVVDMDGIVADFLEGLWDAIETHLAVRGDTELVTDFFNLSAAFPPGTPTIVTEPYFHERGFFRGLPVIHGAQAVLKQLQDDGHEIIVCTAPCTSHSAEEKLEWLHQHFPFINPKDIFIGHKKHLLKADVLIDDGLHNAKAYRAAWPNALIVTIAYPYNFDLELGHMPVYDLRASPVEGFVEGAWNDIYRAIERYALGL